jgi:hypothetical protein
VLEEGVLSNFDQFGGLGASFVIEEFNIGSSSEDKATLVLSVDWLASWLVVWWLSLVCGLLWFLFLFLLHGGMARLRGPTSSPSGLVFLIYYDNGL